MTEKKTQERIKVRETIL